MAHLAGYIERVIFSQGGFCVLDFNIVDASPEADGARTTAVRGSLPGILQMRAGLRLGVSMRFTGEWVVHKKHGRQFKLETWEPWFKNTWDIERFLTLCIDGFTDPSIARALVSRFGEETFEALDDDSRLSEPFDGIDPERMQRAVNGWRNTLALRNLGNLLEMGSFTTFETEAVLARFGLEAVATIQQNPYRLLEITGLPFVKVDELARSLGIDKNDPRRVEGAILWSLQDSKDQGHLFIRRGDLPGTFKSLLSVEVPFEVISEAVDSLAAQKSLVLDPNVGVYLPVLFRHERDSAKFLARVHEASEIQLDLAAFLREYEEDNSITLSDSQKKAVETLAQQRVLVLTGLPGTGKTMVIRTFVHLFERAGMSYALMAPTGIAAKRLANVTGRPAGTIHRLLKYNGHEWEYGRDHLFPAQAVIVDEMSMVDQTLFFRLLSALDESTVLVLVGDAAQLPSVGPGSVLQELMSSTLPHIALTQIFRQSEKGDIVSNSHRINKGETPILEDPRSDTEFKFLRMGDEDKIAEFIVEMSAKLKAKDANFQVLSPKYEGPVGVNNLNDLLRERLNPLRAGLREWRSGPTLFREGDRLMVVKNDYQLQIYNGDVGKLLRVEDDHLKVRIYDAEGREDAIVEIAEGTAGDKLRLAYAVTVHKSQGSEFDTIILPIVRSQGRMLQRNLLYTAVTRARKRVWLIGDESAILAAVRNNKVAKRNTVFAEAIKAELERAIHGSVKS